jgi:hypothetical protein
LMQPFFPWCLILHACCPESQESDLGVFLELVLWWFLAKWKSGSATHAIEFLRGIFGAWQFSPTAVAGIIMPTKPTIMEMDTDKLEDALRRAEAALNEEDYSLLKAVVESYAYIAELVGDKNTTIQRLRKMLFGASTEKTAAVIGEIPYASIQFTHACRKHTMQRLRWRLQKAIRQQMRKQPWKRREKGMAATGPTPTRAL